MRYTADSFASAARAVHGGKYGYSKVVYKTYNDKVTITCPEHGDFDQTPNCHIGKQRQGCPECGRVACGNSNRSDKDSFIKKSKELYGKKYDYSKVVYVNSITKVKLVCPDHGEFECVPKFHLSKRDRTACSLCRSVEFSRKMTEVISKRYEDEEYRNEAISHGTRSFNRGYYDSIKGGRVYYRSNLELEYIKKMDADVTVSSFSVEPFAILYEHDGRTRRYFVDFLVNSTDGSRKIVEVKPGFLVTQPKNKAKFDAARSFATNMGMGFEIWS